MVSLAVDHIINVILLVWPWSSCWLAVIHTRKHPPETYRELIKLSFITFYNYTYVMFYGLANVGLSLAITTTTREKLDK